MQLESCTARLQTQEADSSTQALMCYLVLPPEFHACSITSTIVCWTKKLVQRNICLLSPWTSKGPFLWRKNNYVIKKMYVCPLLFLHAGLPNEIQLWTKAMLKQWALWRVNRRQNCCTIERFYWFSLFSFALIILLCIYEFWVIANQELF